MKDLMSFHSQNVLVLEEFEFETNALSTDTFDPSVTYSGPGTPTWVFESGDTESGASISVTGSDVGLDGTTQTVKLKVVSLASVTGLDISDDKIINTPDFSTLEGITDLRFHSNNGITSFTLPAKTGIVDFHCYFITGLTGTLDISNFQFTTGGLIEVSNMANVTAITFNAAAQTINYLSVAGSDLTGTLDISMFTFAVTFVSTLNAANNANLTAVNLHVTNAGTCETVNFASTGLTTIDVSTLDIKNSFQISSSTSLISATLGTIALTGATSIINFSACSALNTYVDLTGVSASGAVTNLTINFNGCALPTSAVNNMLVDLDNNLPATAPATASINFAGGTNGAPDSSTGGNDGDAAVTSLQGKGYTVTTN